MNGGIDLKKILKSCILAFFSIAILLCGVVSAKNVVKIVIDGIEITPRDADGKRVDPIIIDGTTYLPVRAVAQALGKEVDWDGETKTVYILSSPIDYTQFEKETEIFQTSINTKAFEKLKNVIINKGKYSYEYEKYSITYIPKSEEYGFMMSYSLDSEEITLYFGSFGEVEKSVLITVYYDNIPSFLATIGSSAGAEYSLGGEFSNKEKFTETINTFPDELKVATEELINSVFSTMDFNLKYYSDLTFEDFGMYYEKN